MLDPEFSPKKMARARARGPRARQPDHRQVRRPGRVRIPRRLRDAAAVDDLPRVGRPAAERPRRLPAVARRHDPSAGRRRTKQASRSAQAAGQRSRTTSMNALEEKRQNPDDRLLTPHRARRGRRPSAHARRAARHVPPAAARRPRHGDRDARLHDHVPRAASRTAGRPSSTTPMLMEPAIEELLRHQTPVMMVPRVIAQDYELGGVKMTAGDSATLMIGAANCDRGRVRGRERGAVRPRARTATSRSAAARTAASARTSRASSCGSRSRSSTSASPSTRSPRAPRSTSRPASARPTTCRCVFPVSS